MPVASLFLMLLTLTKRRDIKMENEEVKVSEETPKGSSKRNSAKDLLLITIVLFLAGYIVYDKSNSTVEEVKPEVKEVLTVVKPPEPKPETIAPKCPAIPTPPACPEKVCVQEEREACPEYECAQPGFLESYCRDNRREFMKTYKQIRNFELKAETREGRTFTFIRGEIVLLGEDRINTENACTARKALYECRALRKKNHKYIDGQNECDRKFNPIIDYLENKFPGECQ